jgi:hypothetical protein
MNNSKNITSSDQLVDRIAIWLMPLLRGLARLNQIDEVSRVHSHSLKIADSGEGTGRRGVEGNKQSRLKVRNVLLKNGERRAQNK